MRTLILSLCLFISPHLILIHRCSKVQNCLHAYYLAIYPVLHLSKIRHGNRLQRQVSLNMPRLHSLTPILPLVLTTVSFAFILLSITSSTWSVQHVYPRLAGLESWDKPIYTRERSPFQICGVSSTTESSADANNSTTVKTYTVSCQKFAAFGFGKTSCETQFALQSFDQARAGDERLCQQIHKSGNLVIAGTTFISLGFLLTLVMTLLAAVTSKSSAAPQPSSSGESTAHHQNKTARKSGFTPFLALLLISSLAVGALTTILSQFYAIIAFIQSQPPNGAWASARGDVTDASLDPGAGPWVEGVVLRAYLTVAWVFAGAAAVTAGGVCRLPRWDRL